MKAFVPQPSSMSSNNIKDDSVWPSAARKAAYVVVLMLFGFLVGTRITGYISDHAQYVAIRSHLRGHHFGCEEECKVKPHNVVDAVIAQSERAVLLNAFPHECENADCTQDYSVAEPFTFQQPTCKAPLSVCQADLGFIATHIRWNTTSNCQLLLCSTSDCHKCIPVVDTRANSVGTIHYPQGFESALWVCKP